jgi:hypothetical protein
VDTDGRAGSTIENASRWSVIGRAGSAAENASRTPSHPTDHGLSEFIYKIWKTKTFSMPTTPFQAFFSARKYITWSINT